jgi:2-dehydro-3-deoxyphosphogluconate aldolase / (4S)-4-hydroxy-2-oxoglutarate aldolase
MAWPMSALERIASHGVLPVVVLDDIDGAPSLGEALVAGGLPCVEITFRTSAAAPALEMLAADPRLTVGAGTILDPAQVERAVAAGAQFIVSPGLDVDVVRRCRELDVAVIPGIATPTEAMAAIREGLDTVKLFPAEALGGLRTVDALAAPFRGLRFIPTGGIGPAELAAYARHPAVLAVGGSWIASRALLKACAFDEIVRLAGEAVAAVAAARAAGGTPA